MSAGARRTNFRQSAPLFAALGDETRLGLLARLSAEGPLSTARLTAEVAITRQAVTKHLATLAGAGLVRDVREGRERRWELDPGRLDEARRSLDTIARHWDSALARLKRIVKDR